MKIAALVCPVFLITLAACSKDAPLQKQGEQSAPLSGQLSGTDAEDFLTMQSAGDFAFEWNGRVCGNGDLQFMGFIYDPEGRAIPYNGALYMGNDVVPQGGANVNFEYEKDPGDTLRQNLYMNTETNLKLTDPNDNVIFDTSIYIPDVAELPCPLPCMNGNKCIPITSANNERLSTYVVVGFKPTLPENQEFEASEDIRNVKKVETSGNEVCMDAGLFDNIPAGAYVSVNILRTNFFTVKGVNKKTYRLISYVSQQGSTQFCP